MLDAGDGVEYEGEDTPQATIDETNAIRAWNMLQNGQGGFDWAGLDVVVELLGIADVAGLVNRLMVIKMHKKKD